MCLPPHVSLRQWIYRPTHPETRSSFLNLDKPALPSVNRGESLVHSFWFYLGTGIRGGPLSRISPQSRLWAPCVPVFVILIPFLVAAFGEFCPSRVDFCIRFAGPTVVVILTENSRLPPCGPIPSFRYVHRLPFIGFFSGRAVLSVCQAASCIFSGFCLWYWACWVFFAFRPCRWSSMLMVCLSSPLSLHIIFVPYPSRKSCGNFSLEAPPQH